MKTPQLNTFFDQRKPLSHITFLIFSLLVTIIILTGKNSGGSTDMYGIFIMLFVQLEVFIFLGNKLFAKLNFDRNPGEITRIVLFRFLIFLTGCMLASVTLFILLQYSGMRIRGEDLSKAYNDFIHKDIHKWFKSTVLGMSAGAVIFIILLWQQSLNREQKLREEKLIFQNETLKNQINPHFLFNSLNTLSSLISSRPEIAEEFIQRLSSIYRYILEYSSQDKVPLSAELAFIKDYFYLHQIRDDGKIQLDIMVDGSDNYEILPVSLQVLVENSIKHNKATRESPLKITIYLENENIIVKNNLQKMAISLNSTQIGLKNLAQRVNLVTGKQLVAEETSTDFIVKIPLLS